MRGCVSNALLAISFFAGSAFAQSPPDWTEPFPPFKIVENLYYVGSKGLANYLITTSQGNILINSDLEANVPLIKASIEKLGFKFSDTKILLISHAHWDHDAGSALVKKLTGAKYMVMDADVPVVESGGKADFNYGGDSGTWYPPTKVDRVLHDGDAVKLGGATLVAHLTAGHTKGTTTWTMQVQEGGKKYDVVIVGSPNVNSGYKLVGNARYPRIADDFDRQFRVLNALPCDFFLGAHGAYFDLEGKYARLKTSKTSPFIDPDGYKAYIAERERAFRTELAKQQAAPVVTPLWATVFFTAHFCRCGQPPRLAFRLRLRSRCNGLRTSRFAPSELIRLQQKELIVLAFSLSAPCLDMSELSVQSLRLL